MSLLTKLERLERMASFRHGDALQVSPDLMEDLRRILQNVLNRPEPTTLEGQITDVQEQIAQVRYGAKLNETLAEPWKMFMEDSDNYSLVRLEARLAQLTELAQTQ